MLGLSLAGLPLTGGALAKLAVKDLFGDGAAGMASQLSAAATTALMLIFVMRLARLPAGRAGRGVASGACGHGRRWPPPRLLVPWFMFPAIGSPAEALEPAKLWDAVWPMLVGAALAAGLVGRGRSASPHSRWRHRRRRGGRVPRLTLSGPMFERADRGLREWPAAGLALLMVALALAAAGYASRIGATVSR